MNAQNQSEGELHKEKGKVKETAKNPAEGPGGLGQALGALTDGLSKTVGGLTKGVGKTAEDITAGLEGTAGQTGKQPQQEQWPAGKTEERGIGDLINSIRESTDRLAENVRENAKSETIIAGLLKEINEDVNKLADEVRGNAKREVTMAGLIRDIRKSTDRLTEETRESPSATEKKGIQQPQQLQQIQQREQQSQKPQQPQQVQQLQDTAGKSTGEVRVPTTDQATKQATKTIEGTLEEYYIESAERFKKEVAETVKRMSPRI